MTKEEAIQAVSTVTPATVSSSSQSIVTSNGETKKDYQASKWFKRVWQMVLIMTFLVTL